MQSTIAVITYLAVLGYQPCKANPAADEWIVKTATDPMRDKKSSTMVLMGDYLPPRDERPAIGLKCEGGKYKVAGLTTGGLIVRTPTERIPSFLGGGLGLRVLSRLNDHKPYETSERVSTDFKGFSLLGGNFGKLFVVADTYRVQFATFENGSLIAEFHPALADSTEIKRLCGLK